MRYLLLAAVLMFSTAVQADRASGQQGGLRYPAIHIGWVDIGPDAWMPLGYENKQQWIDIVSGGNQVFQEGCRSRLRGHAVVGAKSPQDSGEGGHDLQVRFTDVRFDVNSYALHAAISFIDSKSGTEVARIPNPKSGYRGGRFSVASCLAGDFEKLAERVAKEMDRIEKGSK
jgi:hypothetical protein